MASPMPVFPLVASMTVCLGFSFPVRSASSMTPRARRSFTEPSGLNASIFTKRLTLAGASLLIFTTGVLPTVSRMLATRVMGNEMAGYSGTPLAKKLGIADDSTIVTIGAPANYAKLLAPLPMGAKIVTRSPKSPALVHVFASSRADLKQHLEKLRKSIAQNGVVWVSWPKRTAKVPTDITEDVIREVALPM